MSRKREPVLVLLDHGLYKELDDEFRLNYCRLWKVSEGTRCGSCLPRPVADPVGREGLRLG